MSSIGKLQLEVNYYHIKVVQLDKFIHSISLMELPVVQRRLIKKQYAQMSDLLDTLKLRLFYMREHDARKT